MNQVIKQTTLAAELRGKLGVAEMAGDSWRGQTNGVPAETKRSTHVFSLLTFSWTIRGTGAAMFLMIIHVLLLPSLVFFFPQPKSLS